MSAGTRREGRGERGATLPEMLVVIVLLGVVGSTLLAAFIAVIRTVAATEQQQIDLDDARLGMDAATRVLRAAVRLDPDPNQPLLAVAQADHLRFYASPGTISATRPTLVDLRVIDGDLVQDSVVPTGTAAAWDFSGASERRTVARDLVDDDVFTFTDDEGAVLAPPALVQPEVRLEVRLVTITLPSQETTGFDVAPTTVQNRVHLTNFEYVPEES